jgi:F0F1-type ATP synthase membrane subunit a
MDGFLWRLGSYMAVCLIIASGRLLLTRNIGKYQGITKPDGITTVVLFEFVARNQIGENYRPLVPFKPALCSYSFCITLIDWGIDSIWAPIHIFLPMKGGPKSHFPLLKHQAFPQIRICLCWFSAHSAYFYTGFKKKGLGYFAYVQANSICLPIAVLEDFAKPSPFP